MVSTLFGSSTSLLSAFLNTTLPPGNPFVDILILLISNLDESDISWVNIDVTGDGNDDIPANFTGDDPDVGSLRWAIEPHSFCHSTADTTVYFSAMPTATGETVVTTSTKAIRAYRDRALTGDGELANISSQEGG